MKKTLIIMIIVSLISILFDAKSLSEEMEERLDSDFQTYVLSFKHGQFYIPYKITSGNLNQINPIEDIYVVEVSLETFEDGILILNMPRKFFDTYELPEKFILYDVKEKTSKELDYEENSTATNRILTIPISMTTEKIEITTEGIPEHFPFKYEKSDYDYLFSPMMQINNGIVSEDVICRDSLELILKSSNDSPICVKTETVTKLVERGLAIKLNK